MTLPKFLLAWSDFNWLWCYARLRPAPVARWSMGRTLALTLGAGGLGALLGVGIGLLAFRQPVGWLPWLLGLWSACVGLCWFGVTGLCWNQRAARLATDPASPLKLLPSRFRFGRWCLGFVYLTLLGIITPFALLLTVENIRGELAWKRERARLVAAGEKLTFREILGPEIPPEQNAGAAEVFAPLFDYRRDYSGVMVGDGWGNQIPATLWQQSNECARLELALKLPGDRQRNHLSAEATSPAVDLADWSQAFRKMAEKPFQVGIYQSKLTMPEPGNPPRDVLAGLAPATESLALVSEAALLPRSQFPIHYDEAFEALLPHLALIKSAQIILRLRCAAHLASGEMDAAFMDTSNALAVVRLLREEPLVISQLVRCSQVGLAASTVWQGLSQHRWSDTQLVHFQDRLGSIEQMPGLLIAFEGERAGGMLSMEQFIRNPPIPAGLLGHHEQSVWIRLIRSLPRSVMRQNQIALARFHAENLNYLREGMLEVPSRGLVATINTQQEKVFVEWTARPYSPYSVLVTMLAPSLSGTSVKTARAQTTIKLAAAACALERYRLAHGAFPEKLEQLVPQFSAAVPLDPMVNQPFKYQRTDDGWFLLYSVGPNGKDDGGVMRADDQKKDSEDLDWPWPVPTRPAKVRLF